jgi:glutamate-ammonia-ligase adenylyltransferase
MLMEYSKIEFADPARAAGNLARVEERLPAALLKSFPALLAQTPAPDEALNYLERFLRPEGGALPRVLSFLEQHPTSLHYLLTVFSYSRFLSETLIQQPALLTTLLRPATPGESPPRGIERARTREDLREEFARFEATSFDAPPSVLLARFKRREYLRIMLRDVLHLATLAETTLEISELADLLLDRGLEMGGQPLTDAYGTPQFTAADGRRRTCELVILALGKLGGLELNYSSDVDLMFLYAADGETSGGKSGVISNHEYFVRQAQAVLQLITENTPEGAVYRVDLRLRPQGSEGELVVALPTALDYYRTRAREWELQMLIRARGAAGDRETARAFLQALRPLIYQREFRLEVVEAVLNAREQITRSLGRRQARRPPRRVPRRSFARGYRAAAIAGAGAAPAAATAAAAAPASGALAAPLEAETPARINVKLSPGGIRDIEFLAQCLQRLHGGDDSWLQVASTLVALQRLHDKGHITGNDFHRLAAAYQFLRTVEHRLQLRDGLQRHTLPEAPDSLDRLARRCGIEPPPARDGGRSAQGTVRYPAPREELLSRLTEHLSSVREIYTRLLSRQMAEPPARAERPGQPEDVLGPPVLRRLEAEFPALAAEATQLISGQGAASYMRRGLLRYLNSALLVPSLMARLEEQPEFLRGAAALFEASDLAVDMLARHPEEIVSLEGDSAQPPLPFPRTAAQRADDLRCAYRLALLREVAANLLGPPELAGSRPMHPARGPELKLRHSLSPRSRAFASEAGPGPPPLPFLERFTDLAEEALRSALQLAVEEFLGDAVDVESGPFSVLALGRMGSREMSVGSDTDLLFLIDSSLPVAERAIWRRVAERLIEIVASHTREGVIFAVDTRLRPRGTEGELVPTLQSFVEYISAEAAPWEAITFLKLRPVGGNLELGAHLTAWAHRQFAARFGGPPNSSGSAAFAGELARVRKKIEQDVQGPRARARFKKMAGGFYDLEYITGYLTLARSVSPPGGNAWLQIRALEEAGVLAPSDADTLYSTATLYRAADHAARLITGRALSGWPEPALAERISRLLERWELVWQDDLRSALLAQSRAIRALYLSIFHPA